MFDDLKPKENLGGTSTPAPMAPPKAVEDIFSDTDKVKEIKPAAKPAVFQPKTNTSLPGSAFEAPKSSGMVKKLFNLVLSIVLLAAVGYGGYMLYVRYGTAIFGKTPAASVIGEENGADTQAPVDNANNITPPANVPPLNQEASATPEQENIQPAPPETVPAIATTTVQDDGKDSDQDGLTDREEIDNYHTNPNAIDTDGDGLFDREEVKVYHTDPNNSDTDGDSFTDGSEVKNGYNPNGSGKLYEIKQ